MFLYELFESEDGGMIAQLRQYVMDYVLPMVSHDVDSVPIQDIEDKLVSMKTGLAINRSLVQQVLDPTKLQMIKKVEGDRVYFNVDAEQVTPDASQQEQERRTEKFHARATDAAKEKVKQRIEANVAKRVQQKMKGKK